MTITPKRRKKLNQEQRKQQHHKYSNKKLMHNSESMLLGQEGGATISLSGDNYVNITSVNSDDVGYTDISVSLCAENLSRMILCNNVIEVVLECPGSLISYDPNDTPICEIISAEKDHDDQADALGFAVYLESKDTSVQPILVVMPYSDDTFNEINVMNEELKHRPLVNELSIAGISNKTLRFDKISSWSFNFNIKSIVNKRDGTISKFQDEIIDDKTSTTLKNVSRFLSFFPTTNKFSLKFKNVKIKKKIGANDLTVKIKVSNELNDIGIPSRPGKTFITDKLTMPKVNGSGTYDFDYSASNKAEINKSGDTPKHTTVVGDFLTRCTNIIDIKHVQLIFMFFYLISQKSVKDSLCGSKVDSELKYPECTVAFFNAISALTPFLNFLPVVYKTINRLPKFNPLSFQDIIANMKQIAGTSGIALEFDYAGGVDDANDRKLKKSGAVAPPGGDAALAALAGAELDELSESQDNSSANSTRATADSTPRGSLTPSLIGDNREGGNVSNYQTGGGDEDIFKLISRIIPMQIAEFNTSPQDMTVTITRPKIMAPYCQPTTVDKSTSGKSDTSLSVSTAILQTGDSDKTKKYISKSLLKGQVTIQVGDVVQFVFDGRVVKAIVCFFKSGKYKYGTTGDGYEADSDIRDYYASMKDKGMNEAIADKRSEPLNLISLINLRGFAYLPVDDDGNILYDCKSKLLRLNNGYRPKNKTSESLKSFGRLVTPGSTEFRIGDIKDILFNTDSLMTLIKADATADATDLLKKITDNPKIKNFAKFLQTEDMGSSADDVIVKKIQEYIRQYGLSKQCGKSSSPNANDVKRMDLFQHKCQEINTRFLTSDIYDDTTKQYNVYKSNEFIQSLLTEKISDSDSTALFQMPYKQPVPELIFWFFTRVASIDMLRAMIMIFQAFARHNTETDFKPDELLADTKKPGQETPGVASFTVTVQGGGGDDTATKMEMGMEMGQSGGKWIKGKPQLDDDGTPTGKFLWYDDISRATYEDADGKPIYQDTQPATEKVRDRTDADVISGYIERLIAIIRINNLSNDNYLKFLTSQLTAAKIKYKSTDIDNMHLFSSSIATQHQAEAIMNAHKYNAEEDIENAKTARETARLSAMKESEDAKNRETARQAKIAEASNGKGTTASRNPFDIRSLFNQKPGSNINNELGTCISGNNAVISCDGKTIRIDLDLAALLSTCGDNIAPADDEADAALKAKEAEEKRLEEERLAAAAAEEKEKEEEQIVAAAAAEVKSDNSGAHATTGAKAAELNKPEADATAAAAAAAAAAAVLKEATAKYNAYVADYEKFINDPVVKYLEYDAAYNKFIKDAVDARFVVGTEM